MAKSRENLIPGEFLEIDQSQTVARRQYLYQASCSSRISRADATPLEESADPAAGKLDPPRFATQPGGGAHFSPRPSTRDPRGRRRRARHRLRVARDGHDRLEVQSLGRRCVARDPDSDLFPRASREGHRCTGAKTLEVFSHGLTEAPPPRSAATVSAPDAHAPTPRTSGTFALLGLSSARTPRTSETIYSPPAST